MQLHQGHRFNESWPAISLLVRGNVMQITLGKHGNSVNSMIGYGCEGDFWVRILGHPQLRLQFLKVICSLPSHVGKLIRFWWTCWVRSGTHSWTLAAPRLIEFNKNSSNITSRYNRAINFPLFFLHHLLSFRFSKLIQKSQICMYPKDIIRNYIPNKTTFPFRSCRGSRTLQVATVGFHGC